MSTLTLAGAWEQTHALKKKGCALSSPDLSDELLQAWVYPRSLNWGKEDASPCEEDEAPAGNSFTVAVFYYALGLETARLHRTEEEWDGDKNIPEIPLEEVEYDGLDADELYDYFRNFLLAALLDRHQKRGAEPIRLLDFGGYRAELSRLSGLWQKELDATDCGKE